MTKNSKPQLAPSPNGPPPKRVASPRDIVIPTDVREAHRVQEMILAELNSLFTEREVFGIKLALEEALVNAMKHGNRMDCSKKVEISFRIEPDCFHIRICDEGCGFNPGDVPDPTAEENLERPCGRGLMLMRHYMDEVRFLERGNVVIMSKACRNGDLSASAG